MTYAFLCGTLFLVKKCSVDFFAREAILNSSLAKKGNFGFEAQGFTKLLLDTQKKGLSGNIENVFEDLSRSSAWLGGTGEAWERGPYYLDGLIPLAFLTNDNTLKDRVHTWCNYIVAHQEKDGFFGSKRSIDWWPRMVIAKAFVSLHRATNDKKIIDFLTAYFHYKLENIDNQPLGMWAVARSLECFEAIQYVYEITNDEKLLRLAQKLINYGYDFEDYFLNPPITQKTTSYISKVSITFIKTIFDKWLNALAKKSQKAEKPQKKETIIKTNNLTFTKNFMKSHGVNISMMLKYPFYVAHFKNDYSNVENAYKGYQKILVLHGTALRMHSCDEHLMGTSPCQGVELCAVVEQMYSYAEMFRLTADMKYQEENQFLCYNVLPTLFDDKMNSHQYVTQANQIRADKAKRQFYDTNDEANIFGIAPNFGCCAANFHQGYPKFIDSSIMYNEHTCYISQLIQGHICEQRKEGKVDFLLSGIFPFENNYSITVNTFPKNTSLVVRLPENYDIEIVSSKLHQQKKDHAIFTNLAEGDVISLTLKPHMKIIKNADATNSFIYGAFLLARKIECQERFLRGVAPFHDKEFIPTSSYNASPILQNGSLNILSITSRDTLDGVPFNKSNAHLEIVVEGIEIVNIKEYKNSICDNLQKPQLGNKCNITLVPIAETYLKITHFYEV